MALTERIEIGKIEVLPMGQIQVRTDTVIERDGVEISRTYHRHVCNPDHDCTNEDQRVKDVANVVHTPAVKTAWTEYKDHLKKEWFLKIYSRSTLLFESIVVLNLNSRNFFLCPKNLFVLHQTKNYENDKLWESSIN